MHVPAIGQPGFDLPADEVELGPGIHREAGVQRLPIKAAESLAERLFDRIAADLQLSVGDHVAVLVNGVSETPAMELAIVARAASRCAARRGLVPERLWCSSFLTALEMPGVSLGVLKVDDERLALLDAPAAALAWPSAAHGRAGR